VDPKVVFSLHDISIMAILVGIVGGVGTVYGPAVGAFIMVAVGEVFRSGGFGMVNKLGAMTGAAWGATPSKYISEAHVLSFGLLVVFVILFLPNGVVGDWDAVKKRFVFWRRAATD
jgi:branched-chain amino acid transport system permease protein